MSMRTKLLTFLSLISLLLIVVFSFYIRAAVQISPQMAELRPWIEHLSFWLILGLVVLAVILLMAMDAFLTIHMVRRLKQMEDILRGVNDVRSLAPFGFNKRYPDELSQLADEVTEMIGRLRQSEELYRASETEFKMLFD